VTCSNLFYQREAHINKQLLLGGALAKKLGNVEVYKVSVMENDRLDRALHLVAFMTVGGDDVHDFAGNSVLVGERDSAEWMPHLLPKFSLNHSAGRVLIVLQRLADIGQQRAGDEIITLNRNATAERALQDIRDRDALERAGIKVFDEPHVDVTGQQRELDRAKFSEGPAFPAAASGDRLVPYRRYFFAQ